MMEYRRALRVKKFYFLFYKSVYRVIILGEGVLLCEY